MPWQVGRLIQGLVKVKAGRAEAQGNPGKSKENMIAGTLRVGPQATERITWSEATCVGLG